MYNYSVVEYKCFDILDDIPPAIRSVTMFGDVKLVNDNLEENIRNYYYKNNHTDKFWKKEFMIYMHYHDVVIYDNVDLNKTNIYANIICGSIGINIVGVSDLVNVILQNEFINCLNELHREILLIRGLSKNKLIKRITENKIPINTNRKLKENILKNYENFLKGNYFLYCKDL